MLWKCLYCIDASYLNMNKILCTAWIIPSAFGGVLSLLFDSISTDFACSVAQTFCEQMTNHCLEWLCTPWHRVSFDHNRVHQPPMVQHKDITWDLVRCTHLKANASQEKFKNIHWHKSRSEMKKWVENAFLMTEIPKSRMTKFYSDLP